MQRDLMGQIQKKIAMTNRAGEKRQKSRIHLPKVGRAMPSRPSQELAHGRI
jgi:hypothetical protein